MTALNKNLPDADTVSWQQVANHVSEDEAQQVFGLSIQTFKIDEKEYSGLRPLEYTPNKYS